MVSYIPHGVIQDSMVSSSWCHFSTRFYGVIHSSWCHTRFYGVILMVSFLNKILWCHTFLMVSYKILWCHPHGVISQQDSMVSYIPHGVIQDCMVSSSWCHFSTRFYGVIHSSWCHTRLYGVILMVSFLNKILWCHTLATQKEPKLSRSSQIFVAGFAAPGRQRPLGPI